MNEDNRQVDQCMKNKRSWLAFFHGLGLACGLITSSWWIARQLSVSSQNVDPLTVTPISELRDENDLTGPWGILRAETIYTEKPAHFIDVAELLKSEEAWLFPDMDLDEVAQWLTENGYSQEEIKELVTTAPEQSSHGLYLHPSQEWIARLDRTQRKNIHRLLALNSVNHFSENPYLFSPEVLKQIRSNALMEGEIGDFFDSLLYPRGSAMCLSDIRCLLYHIKDQKKCPEWLKLLTRTETILLKLEIDGNTDIPSLVNYWSGPFNYKDFLPLLESLKRENHTTRLDVIHLLPPVARQIIYTYPIEDGFGEKRDCHWTAMNFFEDSKNDRYLDLQTIAEELSANFVDVEVPEKFGDIVMFSPGGNDVVHSCVYIAADMVFTKNGLGVHQPWTITTLQEVTSIYGDMKIIVKRRKS